MNKLDVTNSGFMDRREANHIALTPISFLSRTANIYRTEQLLFVNLRYSWSEIYDRAVRPASALVKAGIKSGEVVTVMAPIITQYV